MSGRDICVDDSGYVYVTGGYIETDGKDYSGTLKYDKDGNLKWFSKYRYINFNTWGWRIAHDNSGNCYVSSYLPNSGPLSLLIKYNYKGDSIWTRFFGDSINIANAVDNLSFDYNRNIYITSYTSIKYDSSGNLLWYKNNNGNWLGASAIRNHSLYALGVNILFNYIIILERDLDGDFKYQQIYPRYSLGAIYRFMVFGNNIIINGIIDDSLILIKYSTNSSFIINNSFLNQKYSLEQNFPNPFNSSTVIKYSITSRCLASILIYDINGREIMALTNSMKMPGRYSEILSYDNSNYSSGVYFYSLYINGIRKETKRMIFLK